MDETYIIDFSHSANGKTVRRKMRVKRCMGEMHAKIKLHDYIKEKGAETFYIHSCTKDLPIFGGHESISDLFSIFK